MRIDETGIFSAKLETREDPRAEAIRRASIHERDRHVHRGNQAQKREHTEPPAIQRRIRQQQRQTEDQAGDEPDAEEIPADPRGRADAPEPAVQWRAESERGLEAPASGGDQVVTGILLALECLVCGALAARARLARGLNRAARDLELRPLGAARELLDREAVAIAGRKVHLREVTLGAQRVVDETDALEQLGPVDRGDQAQARDRVADRHVQRALSLVLAAHDLFRSRLLRRESFLQPLKRRSDSWILIAQPLHELNRERARQRSPSVGAQHRRDRLGVPAAEAEQSVGHAVRLRTRLPASLDALGRAPQIFDEGDAQRDRNRPELADREWLHALVGPYESAQQIRVEATVGVSHERPGQTEDSRVTGERTFGELRQLPVISGRQVVADFADLVLDDVEVVDQPLCPGSDRVTFVDDGRDRVVRAEEHPAVVGEPAAQRVSRSRSRSDSLRQREALAVLLEALGAEQLLADQLLGVPWRAPSPAPESAIDDGADEGRLQAASLPPCGDPSRSPSRRRYRE